MHAELVLYQKLFSCCLMRTDAWESWIHNPIPSRDRNCQMVQKRKIAKRRAPHVNAGMQKIMMNLGKGKNWKNIREIATSNKTDKTLSGPNRSRTALSKLFQQFVIYYYYCCCCCNYYYYYNNYFSTLWTLSEIFRLVLPY